MSDTTGDEVETVDVLDLPFEEAVAALVEGLGMPEEWAATLVAQELGLDQEGPIEVEDDDLT